MSEEFDKFLEQIKEDRDLKEIINDHLLLLYTIKKHDEISMRYLGITKLQKYIFLSEDSMNVAGIKGLNYKFFRGNYGPMSKQIYKDLELFRKLGLIHKERIKLTEKGEEIIKAFWAVYQKNEKITEKIDKQIQKLAIMDTEEIKQYVYNLEKPIDFIKMKIRDIPMSFDIISKLSEDKAQIRFDIGEEDIETLNILLDDETLDNILQIISCKEKSIPYEGLV